MILGEGGTDATRAFEDVQHSNEARELLKEYLVGYSSEVRKPSPKSGWTLSRSDRRMCRCLRMTVPCRQKPRTNRGKDIEPNLMSP